MEKVKVSFEWLSACSGCELAFVDLHERLADVLARVDIVRLPILSDEKGYPKAKVGIISGALRTQHDVECAHHMRESCDLIMAMGVCSVYGGPQGAGYASSPEEIEATVYRKNPTTQTDFLPTTGLPPILTEGVRPLDAEISVDYYLPGCPPHPYYVLDAMLALLDGKTPEFDAETVCFRCDRRMSHTEQASLRRTHEGPIDAGICFLSQGILCMGSATLDRCMAACPKRGAPCTGCSGPSDTVVLEPHRDVRTEIADRMCRLTRVPRAAVVAEIEKQAPTYYAYAMASPVFRQKPTFLLRRWIGRPAASSQGGKA